MGGLLAIEYALKYQQHLKGLVISNMAASTDSFVKDVSTIRSQFSADIRAKLKLYENSNKTDDPAYQELLFDKLYKVFICRLDPWPDPVLRSLGGWNQHVYKVLQGRSEFEATGRMRGWDRWADLPKIKVRTLTMGSPKPLIGTEGSDAHRWRESALIRLSDLGHGETKRDTRTISRDGETMTIQDRSTTPHGVVFATLVMHRQH